MAHPLVRYCPHGHDKNAPGGQYVSVSYGKRRRECAGCARRWALARYYRKQIIK